MSDVVAADRLRSFIERIERVESERDELTEDRKEIYNELKGDGFDSKAIRKVIRIRKQDRAKRMEEEAVLDTYLSALGID
jgi:uncharacterized protein (UPF0335 family)